jgi:hypothetical protein
MIQRHKKLGIIFDVIGAYGQIYGNGKEEPEIDPHIPAEIPGFF